MQEINSSSMSDIAFLLLVFFLVTTTISLDKGISLILPAEGNEMEVNKKNIVKFMKQGGIPVIAGFQGINLNGKITSLGRGRGDSLKSIKMNSLGSRFSRGGL